MSDELVCARCNQPIRFRELFHSATRAAMLGDPDGDHYIVSGEKVIVHDYPCPSRFEVVDGRLILNGVDAGSADQFIPTTAHAEFYGVVSDIQTPEGLA